MSTEVASLKIKVDTSDTVKATNDLNKLTNTAKSTEKQTQSLTNAFFSLKGAIATLGVAQTAQYFVKTADSMNLLNARLKLTTFSMEEFNSQQKKLLEISKSSYTSISDTVTLYTKLDPALKQLGASTSQVNSVVESFTKGLQLGGASAQESSSAILQFAQAMGSGVLRGDEFNSMAEASPKLMKYMADGMGVPQTALRKMAENGELTALRVSNALLKMKSDIDRDFVTLPVTVAKATTNAMTDLSLGISDIDSAIGITKGLATAITELSSNIGTYSQTIISFYQETAKFIQEHNEALDTTGTILKTVASAYVGFAVTSGIAKGITAITASVYALRTSILLLQTSIPIIGWVAAAVGAAAGAYVLANDMLDESNDAQSISIDKLKAKIDELEKRKAGLAQNKFKESNEKTINIEIEALKSKLKLQEEVNRKDIARAEDVIPKEKTAVTELVGEYDGAFKKIDEIQNTAVGSWKNLSDATKKAIDPVKVIRDEYQSLRDNLKSQNLDTKENLSIIDDKEAKAIDEYNKKIVDSTKDKNNELKKINDELKRSEEEKSKAYSEIAQIGMTDYEKSIESIKEKTINWVNAGVNNNDVLAAQKELLDELNIQQSLNSASDELSFLEKKAEFMTDEYEKSKLILEIKHAQALLDIEGSNKPIDEKQLMIEKENELYNLTKERIELDRDTEYQNTIKTFQEETLDRQIALNQSMYEFGDSFDGVAKHISTASKAIINMNTISIKAKKEEDKLNEKYTKSFNKYAGDVEKTKELEQQYNIDSAQIKEQNFKAEIAGYANLAGAMASAFEQGSAGAIAFTTLQATLGIVSSWTAIAEAWALPFPSNIPAVAMVAGAVLPIIGQLSAMGGGGSGGVSSGGGTKKPTRFELKEQEIEDLYTPMTDRLDRQIELLESIDRQGSASALGLEGSKIEFQRDYELAVNNILKGLPNDVRGYGLDFNQQLAGVEARLGFNLADVVRIKKSGWDKSEKRIYTDYASLSQGFNLLKVISDYFATGDGATAAWFGGASKLNLAANEIQGVIGNFTQGIISSLDDMRDAADDFRDIYDEITGTAYFENKRLSEAYEDVARLTKESSLEEYLKNNIEQIELLQRTYSDSVLSTLLSQDPKDMAEQIRVLDNLQQQTGLVFTNGAREALDFMESIKLVGDAMSETAESRKSLIEDINSFVKELFATTIESSSGTTFKTFADSFNNMIDAIAKGSSDLDSIGETTLSTAQAYIDTVSRTASTSAEVQFAKKVVANKLSSVANAPDITLGTINDTLKISFNENSAIVNELKQMRTQLEYLNGLNTTQTATQLKTLSATRALIS